MLNVGSQVKVTSGKDAGVVGEVFWLGMTKFQKPRVGVTAANGNKVWVKPEELAMVDGSPVVTNLPAEPPKGGFAAQPKGQTRAKVALLEMRVSSLEKQVAELLARIGVAK